MGSAPAHGVLPALEKHGISPSRTAVPRGKEYKPIGEADVTHVRKYGKINYRRKTHRRDGTMKDQVNYVIYL
jgi:hypothetical protein